MRKRIITFVLVCAGAISLNACGGSRAGGKSAQEVELPVIMEDAELGDAGTQEQIMSPDGQQADTPSSLEGQYTQGDEEQSGDEKLEAGLAAYRQAREDNVIDYGNGVTGGSPGNPEDYGFSLDLSAAGRFDSRELTEGYAAGKRYVETILGFVPETRNTVYTCVDPRIQAIYDAEDKGVADGYAPENIFVCEYCDHGTWQYLILVREGKGSAWEVIHHGSSYMAEEDEY